MTQPCDGLDGLEAKKCCALADYEISADYESMMLDAFRNFEPSDAAYVQISEECTSKKRKLAETKVCSTIDYHHNEDSCTMSPYVYKRLLLEEGILEIPDPPPPKEITEECKAMRFLVWTRNTKDFNAGHSHKGFSYTCAVWEAIQLNRTLVIDTFSGMGKVYTGLDFTVEVPHTLWYSLTPLKTLPNGGLIYSEYEQLCGALGVLSEEKGEIEMIYSNVTHKELLDKSNVPVIVRNWEYGKNQLKYGYQICRKPKEPSKEKLYFYKEPGVDYSVPTAYKWPRYANWMQRIASDIDEMLNKSLENGKIDPPVCLHVRRGEKLKSIEKYPNLEKETNPDGIYEILSQFLKPRSTIYIASNESNPKRFFAPLESSFNVVTLGHLPKLIQVSEFLPSTLALIDYAVLAKCKRLIPTFKDENSKGFEYHLSLSESNK
eukprot:CAMPEP_0171452000 /NCGR_PEP_ID=MMETSP0945-20130129/279_1 /TAXON_ID=109269 /ORGANISM="Vaucheria litorea, Strain CCMP2940" /LENGTH=432 /DNA_ID=CAMNT_0011976571 /DNA_START=46 /DNA_END=1344 /DNA_ORIENTATION=+